MNPILQPVVEYYSDRIRRHGPGASGVDWNSEGGQRLRFATLARLLPADRLFTASLDDYGCGYGALLDFLGAEGRNLDYLGLDVAPEMIDQARRLHPSQHERFVTADRSPRTADFAVASGIFNVRLSVPHADWEAHVARTLDAMHSHSRLGLAFNCLSLYSDPGRRRPDLFYADPCFYFDLCKRRYGCDVALLHDYGLYEFTILVRKSFPS